MNPLKLNKTMSIIALSTLFAFNTNSFAQSSEETVTESHTSASIDMLQNDPQTIMRLKLLKEVKENKFGADSIKQFVNEHPKTEYVYYSHDEANDCKTLYNIFSYCQYSNSADQISKKLLTGKVNIDAIKDELSKAIENATNVMESGSGIYYLSEADDKVIIIDTNYPLEANPVVVKIGNKTEALGLIDESVNDQKREAKEHEVDQRSDRSKGNSSSSISK